MTTTIQTLATEFDIQAHEVRASLDLGDHGTDADAIDTFDGWTADEAREVLATLAQQKADLA